MERIRIPYIEVSQNGRALSGYFRSVLVDAAVEDGKDVTHDIPFWQGGRYPIEPMYSRLLRAYDYHADDEEAVR